MKIKLWTIQRIEAWEVLQSQGYLIGRYDHIEPDWVAPYIWLMGIMKKKIGIPKHNDQFPVWAWYQYENKKRNRPDLRKKYHFEEGAKGIRIEFQKDEKDILLSDFNLWHCPFAYKSYINDGEEDYHAFEQRLKEKGLENLSFEQYPDPIRREIEESWLKIFDLDFECSTHPYNKPNKRIQATFWQLNFAEITKVDFFTAR